MEEGRLTVNIINKPFKQEKVDLSRRKEQSPFLEHESEGETALHSGHCSQASFWTPKEQQNASAEVFLGHVTFAFTQILFQVYCRTLRGRRMPEASVTQHLATGRVPGLCGGALPHGASGS